MKNPVWPSSCVTPAGTSNELDVQNEWEENTHNTDTSTQKDKKMSDRSGGKNDEWWIGFLDVSSIGGERNSIILTKHDYRHHRVGTCSSSTNPSRRPREPSKASSWSLRYMHPPRRVRKPPQRVRGGALEVPRSLLEDTLREGFSEPSWRLREGFVKGGWFVK